VIELGDELVGFVVGDRRRGQGLGWIASIAVHPDHRRKGYATQLLLACEKELGMPRVRLSLRRSNEGALRLYRQQGYLEIDRWPRYYRNGEDAIVMEKDMG
jgi:ribosomal-protein-alanine N-acetyltransferase